MNKLVYFIFIIFVAFLSCDGRDRIHKSNEEVLIENKLLDSFSESIKYFPETYSEVETDTLLSNGIEIKIKIFTDMSKNILIETKEDSIVNKHFYREREVELKVLNQGKVIFSESINKAFFHNKPSTKQSPLKNTILKDVLIEEIHLSSKSFKIDFLYYYPNDDYQSVIMRILFNDDGTFEIFPETVIS